MHLAQKPYLGILNAGSVLLIGCVIPLAQALPPNCSGKRPDSSMSSVRPCILIYV
jgi:hypothetical protein